MLCCVYVLKGQVIPVFPAKPIKNDKPKTKTFEIFKKKTKIEHEEKIVNRTVPLKLYWNANRGDNFTLATANGEREAEEGGYNFARTEGYVFSTQQSGTVPLKLFWNTNRGDNFTTATTKGENDAEASGYSLVRIEGYIFSKPHPGTVPLKLFWNALREDNFTTATSKGEVDAKSQGYVFARIEGYIFPRK